MSEELECCQQAKQFPHNTLKATKDGTRIYVFIGSRDRLIRYFEIVSTAKYIDAAYGFPKFNFPC